MDILYLLILLSIVLVFVIIKLFLWAVNSDQFDDLEGPAYQILMDDVIPDPVENDTSEDKKSEN